MVSIRNYFTLKEFIDVYWAWSIDDRKRISGEKFYLGNCLVSCLNKKYSSISLSTKKFEYIVAASCFTQVIWIKQTLEDLLLNYEDPIVIHCDNMSAINISKNLVMHSKTKHISIKYHFKRTNVTKGCQIGVSW